MKLIATLIASVFAVSAFAAEPAKKEEVKPAATATAAPSAKTETKSDTKAAPAKKDDKKPADATPAKK